MRRGSCARRGRSTPAAPAAASRPTHNQQSARGGTTELANLVSLCRRHHRLVHEGGWTVDHRHRFRNRHGLQVPDAPPQLPASASSFREGNAALDISAHSYKTDEGDPLHLHLDLDLDDLLRIIRRPRNWQQEAREIVQSLDNSLRGRRHGRYSIEGARWYGAVCNRPENVVVASRSERVAAEEVEHPLGALLRPLGEHVPGMGAGDHRDLELRHRLAHERE